jgi:hypothetical protein
MDLLKYSDTVLTLCLKDKTPREIHNIVRSVAVYPNRLRICDCSVPPWTRQTLSFLGVNWSHATTQCSTSELTLPTLSARF